MSPVAAPADRRFRRAHVKPARRRRHWRALVAAGRCAAALRRRCVAGCTASIAASAVVGARARAAGRSHRRPRQRAAVEGRSARGAERPARREPGLDRSRRAGASGCWRRRGCATPRCGARCRRRSKSSCRSGSRSASAGSTASMYLVDERGVIIDEYGPQYADLDLPIIDGLSAAPDDGGTIDRRGARRAGGARDRRAAGEAGASRGGCRRSTCSDLHNAAVILTGDPAVIQLGEDQFCRGCSRISSSRRRCASASPTSTTSTCGSTIASTCGRPARPERTRRSRRRGSAAGATAGRAARTRR